MAWGEVTLTITDENTAHFYMNRFSEFDMVRGGEAGGDDVGGEDVIPTEFQGTWEGDHDANGVCPVTLFGRSQAILCRCLQIWITPTESSLMKTAS